MIEGYSPPEIVSMVDQAGPTEPISPLLAPDKLASYIQPGRKDKTKYHLGKEGKQAALDLLKTDVDATLEHSKGTQLDSYKSAYDKYKKLASEENKKLKKLRNEDNIKQTKARLSVYRSAMGKARYQIAAREYAQLLEYENWDSPFGEESPFKGKSAVTIAKERKAFMANATALPTEMVPVIETTTPEAELSEVTGELLQDAAETVLVQATSEIAQELGLTEDVIINTLVPAAVKQKERFGTAKKLLIRVALALVLMATTGGYMKVNNISASDVQSAVQTTLGQLKEGAKGAIMTRSAELDRPDCVTLANVIEDNVKDSLQNGALINFAAGLLNADGDNTCAMALESQGFITNEQLTSLPIAPPPPMVETETPVSSATTATSDSITVVSNPDTTAGNPTSAERPNSSTAPSETVEQRNARFENRPAEIFSPQFELMPQTSIDNLTSVVDNKTALEYLNREFKFSYLIPEITTEPNTGITYTYYKLPEALANNPYIRSVLGTKVASERGERLPDGVFAMKVSLPDTLHSQLGSNMHLKPDHAVGFDPAMMSQVLFAMEIQYKFEGVDSSGNTPRFRPTDRIQYGDAVFMGSELESGQIATGTPYLCTDEDGSWRLAEYPNVPTDGSCASLMWNFNPLQADGTRLFTTDPHIGDASLSSIRLSAMNDQMNGLTTLFRQQDEARDMMVFPAFAAMMTPTLFQDTLFNTVVGAGTDRPNPQAMTIAGPDQKYSTYYGFGGHLLTTQPDAQTPSFTSLAVDSTPINPENNTNRTFWYVGVPAADSPQVTQAPTTSHN